MKRFQQASLFIIIGTPVVLGTLLLFRQSHDSTGPGGRVGFKRLGVVNVEGVIFESEPTTKQLLQLREDNLIAGVLLRIDSPGGATAPSQEIYDAVWEFRRSGKPLVVSMGSVAASGGYYIAAPAKRIFADAGTLTGSIGVIMTVPLYKDLAKKIGIEMRTFKAGDFKDLANPYRPMQPKESRMVQDLLDDTHQRFIDDVARARSIERDTLARIADGRIFTGLQAIREKLVDTIGGYEAALSYLRSITGLSSSARIVNKKETSTRVRDWFTREMVRMFPQAYRLLAPLGMQCLTVFE